MSQQGGSPARHEDDWWGELYDDATDDTRPTPTTDSLDDRFLSAADTLDGGEEGDGGDGGDGGEGGGERKGEPGPAYGDTESGAPADPRDVPAQRAGTEADDNTSWPHSAWQPRNRTPQPPAAPEPDLAPQPDRTPQPDRQDRPEWPERPGQSDRADREPAVSPEPAPWRTPTVGDVPSPADPRGGPVAGAVAPSAGVPWGVGAQIVRGTGVLRVEPEAEDTVGHVGSGPPTYDAEPTALPAADPDALGEQVPDTVLDGARHGTWTLRAASVRGDSARFRGEPRRDALLTARFGTGDTALVLVALATGARAAPDAHRAAAELCALIGRAVGRSRQRLSEDIRAARRGDLKSGLHRLTDRSLGKLRASAVEQGVDPQEYAAGLRCLLLPTDPDCRTRVFFGVGDGGLFRLREGEWQDIEPRVTAAPGEPVVGFGSPPAETPDGDRLTMDLGIPTPPSPYEPALPPPRDPFRFRASVARPGDALLLCSAGLAEPLRGEAALRAHLVRRWSDGAPPGLAAFLADTQVRVKGYADDRTAAAVWEA
ncbi:protein phosphatase 2C domain-containing protein [Streptomyces sp. NPDC026672]|uniref:protein phosphatase 2C domain-containing protein n=1 Tax=unclassified Streptomyces TaxID=2593676 RepID=UPI0033FD50E3